MVNTHFKFCGGGGSLIDVHWERLHNNLPSNNLLFDSFYRDLVAKAVLQLFLLTVVKHLPKMMAVCKIGRHGR